ncbi:MAG TPA: MaoC family dehydratase N-terminal domain-containing protein [Actinomycetota bacterium]
MPLNPALEGKAYSPISFEVAPDLVARFSSAVGEDGSFVPPTFVTVPEIVALAQVIADPDLGLDFARVVHGGQEYEWRRPVRESDTLSVTARIAEVRITRGFEFLTVETEMRDDSGELVVLARNGLIVRNGA